MKPTGETTFIPLGWLAAAVVAALTLGTTVNRPMWGDEAITKSIASADAPWPEKLKAFSFGADGMGPGFYFLSGAWEPIREQLTATIEKNDIATEPEAGAARLPWMLLACFCAAWAATKIAEAQNGRRLEKWGTAAAATALILAGNTSVTELLGEWRAYPMLLAGTCLVIGASLQRAGNNNPSRRKGWCAWAIGTLLLIGAHPIGVLTALLATAGLGIQILSEPRGRNKLLELWTWGWPTLLAAIACAPAYLNASQIPKPWGYAPVPAWAELATGSGWMLGTITPWALSALILGLLALKTAPAADAVEIQSNGWLVAWAVALLPLPIWLFSQEWASSSSLWLERYLVPTWVALGLLLSRNLRGWLGLTAAALMLAGLIYGSPKPPATAQRVALMEETPAAREPKLVLRDDLIVVLTLNVNRGKPASAGSESVRIPQNLYIYDSRLALLPQNPKAWASYVNLITAHENLKELDPGLGLGTQWIDLAKLQPADLQDLGRRLFPRTGWNPSDVSVEIENPALRAQWEKMTKTTVP